MKRLRLTLIVVNGADLSILYFHLFESRLGFHFVEGHLEIFERTPSNTWLFFTGVCRMVYLHLRRWRIEHIVVYWKEEGFGVKKFWFSVGFILY